MAQEAGLGQPGDQFSAGGIGFGSILVEIGERVRGKALDLVGKRAVALFEEWPGEEAAIGHRAQLPANSAGRFSTNARYARRKSSVCMQSAWAWASASIAASRLMLHSWLSMRLGHHMGEGGSRGELGRELAASCEQPRARAEAVEEAPALALLGAHRSAGEQQLGGPALPDDPRQQRAGAHVAPARPTRTNRNAILASRRADAQVARERETAPAPTLMPSIAAITGCGQARIALTTSPVMRVNASRPFMSRSVKGR